jgi:hypothetical protein
MRLWTASENELLEHGAGSPLGLGTMGVVDMT